MTCSLYHAQNHVQHAAIAILADEIQRLLWNMHRDILDHRMRMLDMRRRYVRRRESTGVTLQATESTYMASLYLSSYEGMIQATSESMKNASNWHHHMSLMREQVSMAALHDVNADIMHDDGIPPMRIGLPTLTDILESSSGGDAYTIEQLLPRATAEPRSPIDV